MIMPWYFRILRRFAVVFVSGGLLAAIEELRLLSVGADPQLIVYLSGIIAVMTALEKAIRDHKDDPLKLSK